MAKKALISKIEPRESGYRIVQIENESDIYTMSEDFFWIDCEENINPTDFWFDPKDNSFKHIPIIEPSKPTLTELASQLQEIQTQINLLTK